MPLSAQSLAPRALSHLGRGGKKKEEDKEKADADEDDNNDGRSASAPDMKGETSKPIYRAGPRRTIVRR